MPTIVIQNSVGEIGRALDFISAFCAEHKLRDDVITALSVPADELLSNTISYGYSTKRNADIQIALELDPSKVSVSIEDDADAFDPISHSLPDKIPKATPTLGGFGLHLVKHLTDGVAYRRENGKNIISYYKSL